ncbi:hypothetical protein Pcinc_012175, partial [Petrolisthes cinctipes]
DCISQPGDFVLTSHWNNQTLHFVIQKTIVQPNTVYERIQYQLEDDAYDSIPDLVRAYVGGKKPITASSGARVVSPVNRTAPLSFYASKYAAQTAHTVTHGTLSRPPPLTKRSDGRVYDERRRVYDSEKSRPLPPRVRRDTAPTIQFTKANIDTERSCSNDGVIGPRPTSDQTTFTSHDDLKTPTEGDSGGGIEGGAGGGGVGGVEEEGVGVVGMDNTPRHSRLSEMYQPSGSDSGNGSGDSVQTSTSDTRNRDSQASFGDTGSVQLEEDSVVDEEPFNLPQLISASAFDLENFNTLLLNSIENKPLDATALKGVKNTLLNVARVLAAHLTKVDLELLNGTTETDYGLGVTTGIELVTLPHGGQLRADLIERTECLKLLVGVTIVMTPDPNERAEIINRWIQLAIDTKTAMGNLYGFAGIILGLCMPEIQRLTTTWHTVRQKFTDSAYNFESKLRSTLKAMNECSNPQAPNTTIPHLLPFILLCERDLNDIYAMHRHCSSILQWETTASDYGLQMLFSHLEDARAMTQNLTLYRRNADHILPPPTSDPRHVPDELTLDMFRTEFHLKFLWGSKGALLSGSEERHAKFHEVLVKLSERCEPG